jgi:hypothetical protein
MTTHSNALRPMTASGRFRKVCQSCERNDLANASGIPKAMQYEPMKRTIRVGQFRVGKNINLGRGPRPVCETKPRSSLNSVAGSVPRSLEARDLHRAWIGFCLEKGSA